MKEFAQLFAALDQTMKTSEKVSAMVDYFSRADAADAAWAVYFLSGRKPRQIVKTRLLREWARECAAVPDWLFVECYEAVGDLAETISLLLPPPECSDDRPLSACVSQLQSLATMPEPDQKKAVLSAWNRLNASERFLWNKLIMGGLRVGVSQSLVIRALAKVSGVPPTIIAHCLMGNWLPTPEFYTTLIASELRERTPSQPYPFFLAYPLEDPLEQLGQPADWQAEWKWDGIRAQIVRRASDCFIWSRGEELVTERYPEVAAAARRLPEGTVLDGELLPWKNGQVRPFAELQKRIGRKLLTKKFLAEIPVVFLAYDLLEHAESDCRCQPLCQRRTLLETLIQTINEPHLLLSELIAFTTWQELTMIRQQSRQRSVEGLMLKRRDSPYRVGRVRGDWWKWKIEPWTIDAVLTAAQRGHGKRASLYTDYTFSVWDQGRLVTIAKAYSGLSDAEIREVDAFIRANTLEKFGPVRTVKPELVFELGFEGIQPSTRHKSGIAVRFPRILRPRFDKSWKDADSLDTLKRFLNQVSS